MCQNARRQVSHLALDVYVKRVVGLHFWIRSLFHDRYSCLAFSIASVGVVVIVVMSILLSSIFSFHSSMCHLDCISLMVFDPFLATVTLSSLVCELQLRDIDQWASAPKDGRNRLSCGPF